MKSTPCSSDNIKTDNVKQGLKLKSHITHQILINATDTDGLTKIYLVSGEFRCKTKISNVCLPTTQVSLKLPLA